MTMTRMVHAAIGMGMTLMLLGCGSEGGAGSVAGTEPTATTAPAREVAAATTGTVIEVKMVTDGAGNFFEPKDIVAQRGDVVRFLLVTGVHNVSFPAAENRGASSLPAPSPYLQLPGQTYDLTVELDPGTYNFHCDPHAALGMVGTLTVK